MPIKAILFDLDDTLIEDGEATERAFVEVCRYAQEQYGLDPLQLHRTAYQAAKHLWSSAPTYPYCHFLGISATEGLWGCFTGADANMQALYAWAPLYQREIWSLAMDEQGMHNNAVAEQLAALFREVRSSNYAVFPEVVTTLRELGKTYQLAMLTNGASDLQRKKIQQCNLAPYFATIAVSGEVGVGKPDPEVFMTVLKDLAVQPQEAAMVGDSLARDILGAHRSGLKAIWINRRGQEADAAHAPMIDARIENLDELQTLIV